MSAYDDIFEELPIYRTDDGMFAALVSGGYDVAFSGRGDFQISDIYLVVDNGRMGAEALGGRHYLKTGDDQAQAFWLRVHDAIVERYRDRIEERICCEMAEAA